MQSKAQNRTTISQILARHAASSGDTLKHADAAAYMGRTPEWLRLQNKAGTAPPSIKVGRERRYLRVHLDAWLAERARK